MTEQVDMRGIEQLASGRFRLRIERNGKRLRTPILETWDEASVLRDALYAELGSGNFTAVDGLSVRQWGLRWLREFRSAQPDYENQVSRFHLHIASAAFADRPLPAVTEIDIRLWVDDLRKKQTQHRWGSRPVKALSLATRKNIVNLARCLFEDARERGYCTTNPVKNVAVKRTAADRDNQKVPEEWPLRPAEIERFLESFGDDPERWLVQYSVGSGLRQGEQWNLELSDVHLDAEHPYVYVRWGSKGRPPKNGKARKVPLFGMALEAMQHWLSVLPTYAPTNPHGLVFPTPRRERKKGVPRSRGGYRRGKSAIPDSFHDRQDSLGRHIWWHLLRHTAATGLLCGWWGERWRMEEVGQLLGHSSIEVTEMYAHLLDSALNDIAARTQRGWEKLPQRCHGPQKTSDKSPNGRLYGTEGRTFESSRARKGLQGVTEGSAVGRGNSVALARELLTAVVASKHERSGMLAAELAESILSLETVSLALDVRAGGPLGLRKAVDLASLLLSQDAHQRHELVSSDVEVDPTPLESGSDPSAAAAR